jgi:D-alanyl-D-alanine carboxypeptidase
VWTGNAAPPISAVAAIVVDEASGAVLYEKDAHRRLAPASLTKIATAVVALQQGDLEQWVDIQVDSREMKGSSLMGLLPGDRFKLNHLLYGLMLPSGNDAALEIGRAVSGSVSAFVDEMNALAAGLGLHNTHFENPHGLDERGHYMSAYDLAMLSRYAMAMPGFWPYSSTKVINVWGNRPLLLKNLNPVLYLYPGGDGVKTGFTDDAGKTLVGSATRNGHRVYIVLLNAQEREGDALLLFDWAFANFSW